MVIINGRGGGVGVGGGRCVCECNNFIEMKRMFLMENAIYCTKE